MNFQRKTDLLLIEQEKFKDSYHNHFMAEVFTGTPGVFVNLQDTINGFNGLVTGEYDDIPEAAFYMVGTIEEALEKAKKIKE